MTAKARGIPSRQAMFGLGDVRPDEAAKAEREVKRMRRSLENWLYYRRINDEVASGERESKLPSGYAKQVMWDERDWKGEQRLANQLHALLSEFMDSSSLPDPDLDKNEDAAAELAEIAVSGKTPSETGSPSAQGVFWIWPVVIIVGGVLFTIMTAIRSRADVAKEKERIACIEAGACTDYGFWLKVGGGALALWLAWDKLGGREAVRKLRR